MFTEGMMLSNVGNLDHSTPEEVKSMLTANDQCQFSKDQSEDVCERFCPSLALIINLVLGAK